MSRPGMHPEAEMTRHLTRVGYRQFGAAPRRGRAGVERRRAAYAVHRPGQYPNQGDAWTCALDNLKRTVEEMALAANGQRAAGAGLPLPERLHRDRGAPVGRSFTSRWRQTPATRPSSRRQRMGATCTNGTEAVRRQLESALDELERAADDAR